MTSSPSPLFRGWSKCKSPISRSINNLSVWVLLYFHGSLDDESNIIDFSFRPTAGFAHFPHSTFILFYSTLVLWLLQPKPHIFIICVLSECELRTIEQDVNSETLSIEMFYFFLSLAFLASSLFTFQLFLFLLSPALCNVDRWQFSARNWCAGAPLTMPNDPARAMEAFELSSCPPLPRSLLAIH